MAGQARGRKPPGGYHAGAFGASVRLVATGISCGWLIVAGSAALAEPVYKWTGEDGVTHYSHRPPPATAAAQQLDLPSDLPPSTADAAGYEERLEKINRRLEVYEEERRISNERQAEMRQAEKRLDQQCARLHARVRDYETTGGSWYELDSRGNRRYLDERQMAERIRQLHETIGAHCR
jgi:hypothetical protein